MWFDKLREKAHEQVWPSDVGVLIGISFMVIFLLVGHFRDTTANIAEGAATISTQEIRPAAQITDFAVNNSCIYVYYDSRGLVEAYDLSGKYLYSLQVHKYKNGIGKIGLYNDNLVIQDRFSNIYLFDGPRQVSYHPAERNTEITEDCFDVGTDGFQCKSGQISNSTTQEVLLDLSDTLWERIITYGSLILLVMAVFFVTTRVKCRSAR